MKKKKRKEKIIIRKKTKAEHSHLVTGEREGEGAVRWGVRVRVKAIFF